MIHDVDESLREMLESCVVGDANIDIAFDAPTDDWSARRQGPAVNLFLYDIREDLERRQVQYEAVRNPDGIVVGRQSPPRRFKLQYLVTTWAQRPEDEHRLLGSVLDLFVASDEFPTEFLQGRIADVGPIRVTVGLPMGQERSLSDIWSAFGGGLRPGLDLCITVPVVGRVDPHVGPPVLEGPKISILGPDGEPIPPMRSPRERRDAPIEPAAPAAAIGRPTPPAREVVDGGRFTRGRQVVELDPKDLQPGRRMGVSTMPPPPRR